MGALLLFAGTLMLFLPGQGILTMLLGISLLDFPGRRKLIDGILELHPIQKSLNWIRKKGNKTLFSFTNSDKAIQS